MAKLENIDFKNGGNRAFRIIEIQLASGTLTMESLKYEIDSWNKAQYEETKTPKQIDTEALASNAAQTREFVKALNAITPAIEQVNRSLESIGLKAVPIN